MASINDKKYKKPSFQADFSFYPFLSFPCRMFCANQSEHIFSLLPKLQKSSYLYIFEWLRPTCSPFGSYSQIKKNLSLVFLSHLNPKINMCLSLEKLRQIQCLTFSDSHREPKLNPLKKDPLKQEDIFSTIGTHLTSQSEPPFPLEPRENSKLTSKR